MANAPLVKLNINTSPPVGQWGGIRYDVAVEAVDESGKVVQNVQCTYVIGEAGRGSSTLLIDEMLEAAQREAMEQMVREDGGSA